jgi:hypothetical protein
MWPEGTALLRSQTEQHKQHKNSQRQCMSAALLMSKSKKKKEKSKGKDSEEGN